VIRTDIQAGPCEKITAHAEDLGPIDASQEIGNGFGGVALPAPLSKTIERTE
jgi:hypothetical protein